MPISLEAKAFMSIDHSTELTTDDYKLSTELIVIVPTQVATGGGRIQPMQGFLELAVGICEFTEKVRWITPFGPSLGQIGSDGPRRTKNLIRK
jgi:hypothetical protein